MMRNHSLANQRSQARLHLEGLEQRLTPSNVPYVVADFTAGGQPLLREEMANADGRLFFFADDGEHGKELWLSDGSPEGTYLVRDILPEFQGVYPEHLTAVGDRVFFTLDDGEHGNELWVSDGTKQGTHLVRDLVPGPEGGSFSSFFAIGERLYFRLDTEQDWQLWASDGSSNGTVRLKDLERLQPSHLVSVGEQFFFFANPWEQGSELWVSDGTPAGTRLVAEIPSSEDTLAPGRFAVSGTQLYFLSGDSETGYSLWVSDGSTRGTRRFSDLSKVPEGATVSHLTVAANRIYFWVEDYDSRSLWTSDGTAAGTRKLQEVAPLDDPSQPPKAVAFGSRLFFVNQTDTTGRELWISDGTPAGTKLFLDLAEGELDSNPDRLTVHNGQLYFFADDGENGNELWVSNGTVAGTRMVADLAEGMDGLWPAGLVSVDDTLYLVLDNPDLGTQLWAVNTSASPATLVLSSETIAENSGEHAIVATLSTTGIIGPVTYSLVDEEGNTDNAEFEILGKQLVALSNLDFETRSRYTVRLRAEGTLGGFAERLVTIRVTDVNEAPSVDTTVPLSFASIGRNTGLSQGQLLSEVVSESLSDPDFNSQQGVAVVGLSRIGGRWQYQLAGTNTWVDFGTVSMRSARLLRLTDRVRFLPNADFVGTARFTFVAWDQTSGTAGELVNLSARGALGGSTAFSIRRGTARLDVVATLLTTIAEDTKSPAGDIVGRIFAAETGQGLLKQIAISAAQGEGVWQYSLNNGARWVNFPEVAIDAALLLRETDLIRFVPAPDWNGTATLNYSGWNRTIHQGGQSVNLIVAGTASSGAIQKAALVVTPVNDAPVLLPGNIQLETLPTGTTDPEGHSVASLIEERMTDVDEGARRGIAIIAASTKGGRWQYRSPGGEWIDVGAVSDKASRLLRDTDEIRFLPTAKFSGTATLTFRGWDQTSGPTAFSTAKVTVTQIINTAPVLLPSNFLSLPLGPKIVSTFSSAYIRDSDAGALKGIAITHADGDGTWHYALRTGSTWSAWRKIPEDVSMDKALLLRDIDAVRFTPTKGTGGPASLIFHAWDRTEGTVGKTHTILDVGGVSAFSAEDQFLSFEKTMARTAQIQSTTEVLRPSDFLRVG